MAGTIEGGRVVIDIDANSSAATAQLSSLNAKLAMTSNQIEDTKKKIASLEAQFQKTGSTKTAAEIEKLKLKLASLSAQADVTKSKMSALGDSISKDRGLSGQFNNLQNIVKGFMGLQVAQFIGRIISSSIQASAQMEQWGVSFRVLTGDIQVAQNLLNDIREFGAVTPFETSELVPAAQMLLGMGTSAEDILDTLGMIGDVSAGLNVPIGEMAYLFGQMQSQGRAMTQDLNQFAARGVPIYATLAEQLHTNVTGIREMAAQGRITFPEIQRAFQTMTSEGGRFYGMMELQSQTLAGRWSTFKDLIHESAVQFGDQLNPALKDSLELLTALFSSEPAQTTFIQQLGAVFGEIITEINMIAQAMRILAARINGSSESVISGLEARMAQMEELRMRYMTIAGGGQLVARFENDEYEYQQNIQGAMTGFRRRRGTTEWERNPNAPHVNQGLGLPTGETPVGGETGGGQSFIGTTIQQSLAQANQYATELEQYKNLMSAKGQADIESEAARVKLAEETWGGVLQIAGTAISGILNLQQQALSGELQVEANRYAKKKEWINKNIKDETARKKALEDAEAEYQQKVSELKRKSAKESRALNLMNAIVQTAAGITSALAMSGPPWVGIAMAAIVGAIGAAQIAMIASTPIPEAKYGGDFMVPPGFSADSALLKVNSGENVSVTPERESGMSEGPISIEISGEQMEAYMTKTVKRIMNNGSVQIRRQGVVKYA